MPLSYPEQLLDEQRIEHDRRIATFGYPGDPILHRQPEICHGCGETIPTDAYLHYDGQGAAWCSDCDSILLARTGSTWRGER